jgi:hypothetical protein
LNKLKKSYSKKKKEADERHKQELLKDVEAVTLGTTE